MGDAAYCNDCKGMTQVVFDHSTGDIICLECALVLESHSIDDTPEWRTFSNDSSADNHDPNRVGCPTDPFLYHGLSTFITHAKPKPGGPRPKQPLSLRWEQNHSHHENALTTIATMADRLTLVSTIKDRAKEIYTKVVSDQDHKSCRGRNHEALLAACVYIACNQEQLPRTVKEICSVCNGATKKDIGRAKMHIMKQLALVEADHKMGRSIRASDFVKRFCSNVGIMNSRVAKAAQEVALRSEEEIDVRRSPISVAAAIIYVISQLVEEEKKPLRDISIATGVAEGTIRNAYKDLYPHLSKIIPSWFVRGVDLKNLCS